MKMKREQIEKTSTIFFAIVTVTALFAVSFTMASQHASAAVVVYHKVAEHHKAHTASEDTSSIGIDHSGSTKLPKTVIGGMIVDGY
jgi:hypothetical protein